MAISDFTSPLFFFQTDNGGSLHTLENQWTTFRKARLDCLLPGFEDMKFDVLGIFISLCIEVLYHKVCFSKNPLVEYIYVWVYLLPFCSCKMATYIKPKDLLVTS